MLDRTKNPLTVERLLEEIANILEVATDDEDLDRVLKLGTTIDQITIAIENIGDSR